MQKSKKYCHLRKKRGVGQRENRRSERVQIPGIVIMQNRKCGKYIVTDIENRRKDEPRTDRESTTQGL